jgi:hypothetical protein
MVMELFEPDAAPELESAEPTAPATERESLPLRLPDELFDPAIAPGPPTTAAFWA